MIDPIWVLLLAAAFDAVIGDPEWLYRALPHPMALAGRIIEGLDRRYNRESDAPMRRRLAGMLAVAALLAGALAIGQLAHVTIAKLPFGWLIEAGLMSVLLAQNGLYRHVRKVALALERQGIDAARLAVGRIVGRDTDRLDAAGVARGALESLAENFADGVTAPLFWGLLLGLPGMLAYKVINTADSMIGHRTPRHASFGWAAARLDDLANLAPARLAAIMLVAAAAVTPGADARKGLAATWRDARRHRSPNAGWPEAALAGALGLALAGPRVYHGASVEDAWMGAGGRSDATAADIRRGLRLFAAACVLQALLLAALALI